MKTCTASRISVVPGFLSNKDLWGEKKKNGFFGLLTGTQLYRNSIAFLTCFASIVNFFQPVMRLVSKTRHGAKVHEVYDTARTLEGEVLSESHVGENLTHGSMSENWGKKR